MAALTSEQRNNLWVCVLLLGIAAPLGTLAQQPSTDPLTLGSGPVTFVDPYARSVASSPPEPSAGTPTFTAYNTSFINYYAHLRDHEPKVTAHYHPSYASTAPKWRCHFGLNNCFLRNRVRFAPFRLRNNFAGAYQALVLDVGDAARRLNYYSGRESRPIVQHAASRVDTVSYFPAHYVEACLNFTYYWDGVGQKSLKLLQRSEETTCIYSDESAISNLEVSNAGVWKEVFVRLDLRYGSPKFVIEFQYETGVRSREDQQRFDYNRLGHIAIRDFSIGFGNCPYGRDDGNECDATDRVVHAPVQPSPTFGPGGVVN